MKYTYFTYKTAKETSEEKPEQIAFDIIHNIGYKLVDFAKTLKELEKDSPNATLSVELTYYTEGLKEPEPSEEQRQQLSALAKIHKRIMDKVKSSAEMEDLLVYGQMSNITMEMIKEIETESNHG